MLPSTCLIWHGAGHPNEDQVAQSLAENGFGRHARIRAGQHGGEGVLATGHGGARRRVNARWVELAGHIAEVTGAQTFQRLTGVGVLRAGN
jgi:hypothetical protein